MTATVDMSRAHLAELRTHLIRPRQKVEELAFLFVRPQHGSQKLKLMTETVHCCLPNELEDQSAYNISLKDEAKARLIKRAHDSRRALVEVHSHLGKKPAEFSGSDYYGFEVFVPHVRWRLKGQPYAAIVLTKKDMDGFVWSDHGNRPQRLHGIEIHGEIALRTNGRSSLNYYSARNEKP